MSELRLIEKCRVCGKDPEDSFVGLQIDDDIMIRFPRGYNLSENMTDEEVRNQVFLLLSTINASQNELLSNADFTAADEFANDFPFFSYLYVLYDFMAHGYYKETEPSSVRDQSGKINWSKTIKNIKPIVQNGSFIYTDFYVRKNRLKEEELFHLVQQYCIYLSFERIGWLFSSRSFEKPLIAFNEDLFAAVVTNKLVHTFNDMNKQLFLHMLNVIHNVEESEIKNVKRYGTNRFEYVWENMIDKVFGIEDKEKYYPTTVWLIDGTETKSSDLRPNTIMKNGSSVLVLDAKYYRYGLKANSYNLPDSSSTHKQITYGEYINQNRLTFAKDFGEDYTVYNAFLLPFDTESGPFSVVSGGQPYYRFGESISNWKGSEEPFERVQGVLVDVKHLLNMNLLHSQEEINALTQEIVSNVVPKG